MAFFNLPFSVRISNEQPIDGDRYIVADDTARDALVTLQRVHEGLQIYHEADQALYYCSTLVVGNPGATVWTEIATGAVGTGGKLATDSIDLAALTTTVDGDDATAFTIASEPVDASYIIVEINGKGETVGDGVTSKACYFSGDGGASARNFAGANKVTVGDTLHWNGSVAGYQLDVTDKINIYKQI
jgi:hypothetical protein